MPKDSKSLYMFPFFYDMGMLDWFRNPYDKYQRKAYYLRGRVQQEMLQIHCGTRASRRKHEAMELKIYISAMYKQGGLENYKYALAMWQIYNALYPEWITDVDKPKYIKGCWENLSYANTFP